MPNELPESHQPLKKRFRESGAWGGILKGLLPINMFWSKSWKLYSELFNQQPEPNPEEQRLKFSKEWIQDWMKE